MDKDVVAMLLESMDVQNAPAPTSDKRSGEEGGTQGRGNAAAYLPTALLRAH